MRRRAATGAFAVLPLVALLVQASAFGARAPQTAPPPTPVPPHGSPSPFITRLTTPADPRPIPRIDAAAVLLADVGTEQVLVEKGSHRTLPVASLTKVMTAVVVIDAEAGRLDRVVAVHPDAVFARGDYGGGATLGLRPGERVSIRGLLAGLLLGSANDAAEALAIEASGSISAFVRDMNAKSEALGMRRTHFASPHGLDDRGRSSAEDVLILLRAALELPTFRNLVGRRFVTIPSAAGPARRIQNRNAMLWLYPGASGIKTGFTSAAGYCLAVTARRGGRTLAVVVLGGRDEVFSDAASLLNHGFAAYDLRTLVRRGEPLGSVRIRGGVVPVVAGTELQALVRADEAGRIERVVTSSAAAAYPPPRDAIVGWVRFLVSDSSLGRVPLVAAELGAPEEPSGPWWARAAGAVARAVTATVDGLFG